MEMNVPSLGIAELCSFDFDGSIAFEGGLPYFRTNMLPFPVTVCPNEQSSSIFGLARNVGCDGFLVLELSEPGLVGEYCKHTLSTPVSTGASNSCPGAHAFHFRYS